MVASQSLHDTGVVAVRVGHVLPVVVMALIPVELNFKCSTIATMNINLVGGSAAR